MWSTADWRPMTSTSTERSADVTYLHHGMDDAGQRVPAEWFDVAVGFALDALSEPGTKVLTHCHMGINRGPSLGFAVLLALGWDPVGAIAGDSGGATDRERLVRRGCAALAPRTYRGLSG